jgi:Xaa-Pro aminopeptidase
LENALGPEYSSRFVSAERLCLGWLETRSPQELSAYRYICRIARSIIAEFFSNKVIIPDITTTDDVVWWIRERLTDLGLGTWFQPAIYIQRNKKEIYKQDDSPAVIRRGDLLSCDFGIYYLGLCTDMQLSAYVCRMGEDDAPQGIKDALKKAARVAEILINEFREGMTGNEIATLAVKKAEAEGLRPLIYTHALGYHGHAAGSQINSRNIDSRSLGEYPLHLNTVYAIEFSNSSNVPEWDNQNVSINYEDDAVYTAQGCKFIIGHQTELFLIK